VALYDKAIGIQENIQENYDLPDTDDLLLKMYTNKAIILKKMDAFDDALALLDRALEMQEHLINKRGMLELASSSAKILMNKAQVLFSMESYDDSLECFQKARELLEKLNRATDAVDLGMILSGIGHTFIKLGNLEQAREFGTAAVKRLKQDMEWSDRKDLKAYLEQTELYLKDISTG